MKKTIYNQQRVTLCNKTNGNPLLQYPMSRGIGLIEAVAGISLVSIFIFSLMLASQLSQKIVGESVRNIQASFLLEEGADAVKILRDTSWSSGISNLASGTSYFFSYNGTNWVSMADNVYIDGIFERKFSLNNVYRDANDDIASSGTLDSGTKKATVSVSWQGRTGTTTKSASFYITNLFSN